MEGVKGNGIGTVQFCLWSILNYPLKFWPGRSKRYMGKGTEICWRAFLVNQHSSDSGSDVVLITLGKNPPETEFSSLILLFYSFTELYLDPRSNLVIITWTSPASALLPFYVHLGVCFPCCMFGGIVLLQMGKGTGNSFNDVRFDDS